MNRNQPNHDTIIHRIVFLAELISSKTKKYAHKGTKAQTNDRNTNVEQGNVSLSCKEQEHQAENRRGRGCDTHAVPDLYRH